jgi:hypothetical protein
MKMTSNIRVHEGQYIADITADLDIFKGQPLALLFKLKRSPTRRENEFLHGLDFSAKVIFEKVKVPISVLKTQNCRAGNMRGFLAWRFFESGPLRLR